MNKLAKILSAATLLIAAPSFAAEVRISAYVDGGTVVYREVDRHHYRPHHHGHGHRQGRHQRHVRHVHHYRTVYAPQYWHQPALVDYRPGRGDAYVDSRYHDHDCHH